MQTYHVYQSLLQLVNGSHCIVAQCIWGDMATVVVVDVLLLATLP